MRGAGGTAGPAARVRPATTIGEQLLVSVIGTVLILFSLVLLAAARTALRSALAEDGASSWFPPLLIAHLFVSATAGAVAVLVRKGRLLRIENRLREANPARPWMWRDDWRTGVVRETVPDLRVFLFGFAVSWSVLASMVLIVFINAAAASRPTLLLLFVAIGLVLGAIVLRQTMRSREYGLAEVRLDVVPIVPGRAFSGELLARIHELPADGISLRLRCVHGAATGSRRSRTWDERVLWSAEETVQSAAILRSGDEMRVPFTFTLPPGAVESDIRLERGRSIEWRLDVRAVFPGIDYRARFELPVFDLRRLR